MEKIGRPLRAGSPCISADSEIRDRRSRAGIMMQAPTPTNTTLIGTGIRSLCSVVSPTLGSPALSTWCSERGTGTRNENNPSDTTVKPTANKALMARFFPPLYFVTGIEERRVLCRPSIPGFRS